MKKKCVVLFMSAALTMAALTGCGQTTVAGDAATEEAATDDSEEILAEEDSADETAAEETTVDEAEEAPAEEVAAEEIPEDESSADALVLDEKQESALYVMDSLLMCMSENESAYAPQNPEFFWSALLYAVGNYRDLREGQGAIESDGVEGISKVYYRVAQEYASALFADYSDLLPVPEGMTNVQVNPEDSEQYLFQMGDRGVSATKITAWTDNGDGTYQATAVLYDIVDGETIAAGEFTLIDNPYADGIADPVFYYTVRDVKLSE